MRAKHGALASVVCAALVVGGCTGAGHVAVEIPFVATVGSATFSCAASGSELSPSDLRLFVHDVALIDAAGRPAAVELTDDGAWQNRGTALLDFESGSDNCDGGTAGVHTTLLGRVAAGDYRSLQFVVGVPFERNHADAAMADAPLNLGRMHWGWQGGYKFLRFEGTSAGAGFRLHLGSTGCEGTIGHITACNRPNRPRVRLDGFVPGQNRVLIDLDTLFDRAGAPELRLACMSDASDPNCRGSFAALGLDLGGGAASGQQSLFRVIDAAGPRLAQQR